MENAPERVPLLGSFNFRFMDTAFFFELFSLIDAIYDALKDGKISDQEWDNLLTRLLNLLASRKIER